MSTRATIILTTDNEHWYHDFNSKWSEGTSTEEAIVLEIDGRHTMEQGDTCTRIVIEEGTPLYHAIMERLTK